jgi:trimethylamine--corrinoid protein Co-methyltransferase
MVSWIKKMAEPVKIDPETLAVDLVDSIGPDGQFLDADHTFNHFRERWYPQLFDRRSFDQWQAVGSYTAAERASQRVERILSEHQFEELPDDLRKELQSIIDRTGIPT